MKKIILLAAALTALATGELLAYDLSIFDYHAYESNNEPREFSYSVKDVIQYDRNTIDAAMSRLLDNVVKAFNDRSDARPMVTYKIAEPNTRPNAGVSFEEAVPFFAEQLDQQGGKQYTLYYWFTSLNDRPDEIYHVVFYYYKENGRIRHKYLLGKYVLRDVFIDTIYEIREPATRFGSGTRTAVVRGMVYEGEPHIEKEFNGHPVTAIADNAFRDKNVGSITIPSSVRSIGENAFLNSNITNVTVYQFLLHACRKAFKGNPVKTITIIPQVRIWTRNHEPRGGSENYGFTDYLDEFFCNSYSPGTYTWDGQKWAYVAMEIPGDFFEWDSRGYSERRPGIYTWENGGWSYQPESQDPGRDGELPAYGVYKWENNTWVHYPY